MSSLNDVRPCPPRVQMLIGASRLLCTPKDHMLTRGVLNMSVCLVMLELFLSAKVVLNDHHLLVINIKESSHPIGRFCLLSGINTFCDYGRITPKVIKEIVRLPAEQDTKW